MRSKIKTSLLIAVVALGIIFLHQLRVTAPLDRAITSLLNGGMGSISRASASISNGYAMLFHSDSLQQELFALQDKLQSQQVDAVRLQLLEQENTELKQQLNFFDAQSYTHIGAAIIGKGTEPLGTTYILDKGQKDSVSVGNAVIVSNGLLIGVIARVEERYAILRLINDNESKIAATVLGKNGSIGIVEGGYGLSVRMNFIPQNEEIKPGETAITSGLIQGVPHGLIIGTVELVERKPHEPFQQAVLIPAAPLDSLRYVSIITSSPTSTPL